MNRHVLVMGLAVLAAGAWPASPGTAQNSPIPATRAPMQVQATVPRVIGMTLQEAQTALARAGLQVAGVTQAAMAAPAGTVVRQSPAAGAPLQPGATAQLVVSSGQAEQRMPRVVGMPLDQARSVLSRSGVQVAGTSETASAAAAPGTVLRQSPAAGTALQPGAVAQLVVASAAEAGPAMPRVLGMSLDQARAVLARSKIEIAEATEVAAAGMAPGTVTRQSPAAGTPVQPGTPARLQVAAAPSAVAEQAPRMPRVIGMRLDQARAALGRAGIAVASAEELTHATATPGTVVRQSPAAGSPLQPGSTAQLRVAVAPAANQAGPPPAALVEVPHLIGQRLAAARGTLREAGLTTPAADSIDASAPAGTVVAQVPEAGSRVQPGTPVRLSVARIARVRVPDLTGLGEAEARRTLDAAGLRLGATSEAESERPAGTVVAQRTAPGSEVPRGSAVPVTLAMTRSAIVPDVRGLTPNQAQRAMAAAGLRVGGITERDAAGLGSAVLGQSQPGGTRIPLESAIDLVVSRPPAVAVPDPPRTVSVPNVVGLPLRQARGVLAGASLAVSASTDSAGWMVSGQTPAAGTSIPLGEEVRLALRPTAAVEPASAPDTGGVAALDSAAAPVDSSAPAAAQTVDSAAAIPIRPTPPPPPPQPVAADPAPPGPPPVVWMVGALLALAAVVAGVRRLARRPAPVASPAPSPAPMPAFETRGRVGSAATKVSVAGKLVSGPGLTIRGRMGESAGSARITGTLAIIRGGEDA